MLTGSVFSRRVSCSVFQYITYLNTLDFYNNGYGISKKDKGGLSDASHILFLCIHYRFLKKSLQPDISVKRKRRAFHADISSFSFFSTCHFRASRTIQAFDNFRCPLVFFVMRASQNSNNLYNWIMGNVNFKYIW